jgi:hypothetical protein
LIVGIGLVSSSFTALSKRKTQTKTRQPQPCGRALVSRQKTTTPERRGPYAHLTLVVRDSVSALLVDRETQSNGSADRLPV